MHNGGFIYGVNVFREILCQYVYLNRERMEISCGVNVTFASIISLNASVCFSQVDRVNSH